MIRLYVPAVFMMSALMLLTACNGSNNPSPTPTAQPANISGDYVGTMNDAKGGSGTATATLAQHGNSAGGSITGTQTGGTITAQISLAITPANAVSGAMVVDYADGSTCSFSTSGAYDAATSVLSGSYSAVTGCTGDTGTYSLTQQCTDTITGIDRRPMTTPKC